MAKVYNKYRCCYSANPRPPMWSNFSIFDNMFSLTYLWRATTPANETADGTTWRNPYGAWASEVDISRAVLFDIIIIITNTGIDAQISAAASGNYQQWRNTTGVDL